MTDTASSRPTPRTNAKPFGRLLLEIFGISFGVILGFLLNEWRLNVRQADFVDRSIAAMEQELSENYDRIMEVRNYHLDLYPDIQAILQGTGDLEAFQREKFRGLRPPQIQTAAYEIGIQRAVLSEIPLEDAKKIIASYTSLTDLKDLHGRYSSAAFSLISSGDDVDVKFGRFLSVAFMDFLYAEEETMLQIENVAEKESFKRWWEILYPGQNTGFETTDEP